MNSFFVMYIAEIKKIIFKRAVWVALAIALAFVLIMGFTNLSAEGHISYVKNEREVLHNMAGEIIDDEFLKNFQTEVMAELNSNIDEYGSLMAYDPGAAFMNGADKVGKKALFDFIYNVVRDRKKVETVTAAEFYEKMRDDVISDGKGLGSTDEEIDIWMKEYDSIEKPIRYYASQGYTNILDVIFLVSWVLFLNIAIALAGTFADEKAHRTDAIILSAKKGRLPICFAKIAAGISVALVQCLVIFGALFGTMIAFFGAEGSEAMIQMVIPCSPWNITIGKMSGYYIMLAVISACLFAVTNMLLSNLTHSAVATMAIQTAVLLTGLFNAPEKLGLLAKLWELRPTMALYYGTFCNTFRYGNLNNVQTSVLVYVVCTIVFAAVLLISYRNSQVESR